MKTIVVVVEKNDGFMGMYVDGVLRKADGSIYVCDVTEASSGEPIMLTQESVDLPSCMEDWPKTLEELRDLQKGMGKENQ